MAIWSGEDDETKRPHMGTNGRSGHPSGSGRDGTIRVPMTSTPPSGTTPPPGNTPRATGLVSVVTPTYNEADNIPLLIERLHAALDPLDHEIIVADDDSPFVSWVATLIARLLLRVPVSDPMSGYFVVSRGAYESTAPTINPRGFKILLEFIGRNRNLKVSEVGYEFANRVHGETKLNRSVIRSYLLGVAELRLGRQINPTFLLYTLVGIVGLVVNSVAFTFAEAVGFPLITTGLNEALDPIASSFLFSVQVSILVLFVLNNEFTFWEQRYRGWGMVPAFAIYEVMSLIGTGIHVAVFTSLSNVGFLLGLLGEGPARVAQNLIGAVVALVVNWFMNTTYLWRRRQR